MTDVDPAYVRQIIAGHMADVAENDDLEDPFTRGFRMGLRVAYIAAGGDVDGSEEQWAELERTISEAGRG